jgi:polar amino acid transport system permease protein
MGRNELFFLLQGLKWTIILSVVAFAGGTVSGLAVALTRTSEWPWLQRVTAGYIALFQGTPLLMQLFVVYYALALFLRPRTARLAACHYTLVSSQRLPI